MGHEDILFPLSDFQDITSNTALRMSHLKLREEKWNEEQ
jgi:hypothetical protein